MFAQNRPISARNFIPRVTFEQFFEIMKPHGTVKNLRKSASRFDLVIVKGFPEFQIGKNILNWRTIRLDNMSGPDLGRLEWL